MGKIVTFCLSTGIQKTITFSKFHIGEVNRSKSYRFDVSGKGVNSARVLSQLIESDEDGSSKVTEVSAVCPVGEKSASLFAELTEDAGLQINAVYTPGFARECCTLLDLDTKKVTELVVEEPVINEDSAGYETMLLEQLESELTGGEEKALALLISGSRPAFWSADIIQKAAALAKDNGILFMADFRGQDLVSLFKTAKPDIIKINEEEFFSTFGGRNTLRGDLELADTIAEKSEVLDNILIVTRGKESTMAACRGESYNIPTENIVPVNTIGCGDAFNAGFLYEYVNSGDVEAALKKGTWCASRNAENIIPGSIKA